MDQLTNQVVENPVIKADSKIQRKRNRKKKENLICPFLMCAKEFRFVSTFVAHIKIHNQDKSYSCRFCNKMFISKGNMTSHEKRHLNIKMFECNKCKKSFYRGDQNHTHTRDCNGIIVKLQNRSIVFQHEEEDLGAAEVKGE